MMALLRRPSLLQGSAPMLQCVGLAMALPWLYPDGVNAAIEYMTACHRRC